MAEIDTDLLNARVVVPEHVLFQKVVGSSALLNLETETYYGLDDIGTRMWEAMSEAETLKAAVATLADEYDAPAQTIEQDMLKLAAELRGHGLLQLAH